MRIKITGFKEEDACYGNGLAEDTFIGAKGEFIPIEEEGRMKHAGYFYPEDQKLSEIVEGEMIFHAIDYEVVE